MGSSKEVLARELKLSDGKLIDTSYANFKAETPPNAEIDRAGAENILRIVAPANASRNLDDHIDTSLTDGLRAEGFFDAMKKKYRSTPNAGLSGIAACWVGFVYARQES